MKKLAMNTVMDKVQGSNPSPPRAAVVAASVGIATAGIVYRVLRHEADEE